MLHNGNGRLPNDLAGATAETEFEPNSGLVEEIVAQARVANYLPWDDPAPRVDPDASLANPDAVQPRCT